MRDTELETADLEIGSDAEAMEAAGHALGELEASLAALVRRVSRKARIPFQ